MRMGKSVVMVIEVGRKEFFSTKRRRETMRLLVKREERSS
jgi:hypothetical protein